MRICAMITLLLLTCLNAAADVRTDKDALLELAETFKRQAEARRGPAYQALTKSTKPATVALHADPTIHLVGMREDNHPIYYVLHNRNAARTISTDDVYGAPFQLDGSGLARGTVGVWDGGPVRISHNEFNGRVLQQDGGLQPDSHATHVAGTIAGRGAYLAAKGMAPALLLDAYDWESDDGEMAQAAAEGMVVSNHSYGVAAGWDWSDGSWYWHGTPSISPTEDYSFGFYSSEAAAWDQLALAAPGYLICKSAGNDRDESGPFPGGTHLVFQGGEWVESNAVRDPDGGSSGYDTLAPRSTGKNILMVGAVHDIAGGWSSPAGVYPSSFTSYGPTDDGRIKPDLCANGVNLTSASNTSDTAYAIQSGTSMSCPSATGSAALVAERFQEVHGTLPLATTLKALLIHTCDEAGNAEGPDYRFGWGLMNTRSAVETVADALFLTPTLVDGGNDEFELIPRPGEELSITMVWADPPGVPTTTSLDPRSPMLRHDLDLSIEHDGSTHLPWVLDPEIPGLAATRGDNDVDNVEQVKIAAQADAPITVRVTHEGFLVHGQPYSLVITGADLTSSEWTDVTDSVLAGAENTQGVTFTDYDDDGDPDLYLVNDGDPNVLLRNDGGAFVADTPALLDDGGAGRTAVWGDFDNDGDRDLYLVLDGAANTLLRNDAGSFSAAGVNVANDEGAGRVANWVDHDLDGLLDLYLVNDGTANRLQKNYGDIGGGLWFFIDATGNLGDAGAGATAVWSDTDLDGDPDPYLGNRSSSNALFSNSGSFGYTDVTSSSIGSAGNSTGAAWGDYNNDGLQDFYVANTGQDDRLFINTGTSFQHVIDGAVADAGAGISPSWADYDNDGDLDLHVTRAGEPDLLLNNNGAGGFSVVNVNLPSSDGASTCAAWADYDGDGDLDLYLAADGANTLFRNDIVNDNHWLHMNLEGVQSNKDAVGARVRLVTDGTVQWREVHAGEGAGVQHDHRVAFGLGAATVVDTVQIFWPSGTNQVLTDLDADQVLNVLEGTTVGVETPSATAGLRLLPCRPNPFNPATEIRFVLKTDAAVNVAVHDVAGRLVRTLARDMPAAAGEGSVRWDGRDDHGRAVPSGAYYAIVRSGEQRAVTRMSLVK